MVRVIKREWEIASTYIFDVALRDGVIRPDWNDFEAKARDGRPCVAVRAGGSPALSELAGEAVREAEKNIRGKLSGVIAVVAFRRDDEPTVEELAGMNVCLSLLAEADVDITWGFLRDGENGRSVTIYAFEKSAGTVKRPAKEDKKTKDS